MKVRDLLQFYNPRYSKGNLIMNLTKFSKQTLSQEPYDHFNRIADIPDEVMDREVVDFDIHLNALWIAID